MLKLGFEFDENEEIKSKADLISLLMKIGKLESRISMVFRHTIAENLDVFITDLECLEYLSEYGSSSAGQLSSFVGITTGAMTNVIDRLEKAGFARRESDSKDRRKVFVVLQPSKISEFSSYYQSFITELKSFLSTFSESELKLLLKVYQGMIDIQKKEIENNHIKLTKKQK